MKPLSKGDIVLDPYNRLAIVKEVSHDLFLEYNKGVIQCFPKHVVVLISKSDFK